MTNIFYRSTLKLGLVTILNSKSKLFKIKQSGTINIVNLISTKMSGENKENFTELRIPSDYGFIAAKQWGNPEGRPVLALHGWQDNAGSFDPLIPWLGNNLRIVAIDFPGHGFSCHKPKGCFYNFTEMLYDVRLVVEHLKWTKYSLLGHSMGGSISLLYASVFPGEIDSVITIDIVKSLSVKPELIPIRAASAIVHRLLIRKKMRQPEPVYTEEEALDRLYRGQGGSTTKSSAAVLLKRGTKTSQDGKGVVYTRDIRLQTESLQPMDDRLLWDYLSHIRCRLLIIKATNGLKYEKLETLLRYRELYSANCKEFRYVEVEGTHHVHMNDPEIVAPLVNHFLNLSQTKTLEEDQSRL